MKGMEGSKELDRNGADGSGPCDGRPPNPLAASYRQCLSNERSTTDPCKKSLVRHPSLVKTKMSDISDDSISSAWSCKSQFLPVIRSGACADIGSRRSMEDVYVCVDNFVRDYALTNMADGPNAFYGVFDGHGGKHAADFARCNLLQYIITNEDFPQEIEKVISSAFLQTDAAFAEACSFDAALASGTTALAAIIMGRSLIVANAGDCRAVLCRRGTAIEMSRDHKPIYERNRIEASGGYVSDGYLNGQLNVARALGDWHMEEIKSGEGGPLSAEPELMSTDLTDEDEFLIIGCDGIWDVFRSQNAVDFARRRLQEHNDPDVCCKDLVDEALKRKSGDNLAAVVVCFQSDPPPNLIPPRSRVHRSFSAEGLREIQSYLDSSADRGGRD